MAVRSNLAWTNITRDDAPEAWDMFVAAQQELEQALAQNAQSKGVARPDDTFKFSYKNDYKNPGQINIGMAIADERKAVRSVGLEGLRRPVESLDSWQKARDQGGYRR